MCTGGRQRKRIPETQAGRDSGRERIRENPSDISKSDLQPSWPPTLGAPIHAAMSSWSNLGRTVGPVMGYQLLRASCHSCHGRAGPAGEAPSTPHSQDEPQEHQTAVGAGRFLGTQREPDPRGTSQESPRPVGLAVLLGITGAHFPATACFLAQLQQPGSVLSPSCMLSRRREGLSPGTTGLRITKDKAK